MQEPNVNQIFIQILLLITFTLEEAISYVSKLIWELSCLPRVLLFLRDLFVHHQDNDWKVEQLLTLEPDVFLSFFIFTFFFSQILFILNYLFPNHQRLSRSFQVFFLKISGFCISFSFWKWFLSLEIF